MSFIAIYQWGGEAAVQSFTKADLKKALDSGQLGESFFSSLPNETKPLKWGNKVLIIHGDIVSPIPITKVTSWSVRETE